MDLEMDMESMKPGLVSTTRPSPGAENKTLKNEWKGGKKESIEEMEE